MSVLAFSYRNSPPDPLWLTLIGGSALLVFSAYVIHEEWGLKKLRWHYFIFAVLLFLVGVGFLLDGTGQLFPH